MTLSHGHRSEVKLAGLQYNAAQTGISTVGRVAGKEWIIDVDVDHPVLVRRLRREIVVESSRRAGKSLLLLARVRNGHSNGVLNIVVQSAVKNLRLLSYVDAELIGERLLA